VVLPEALVLPVAGESPSRRLAGSLLRGIGVAFVDRADRKEGHRSVPSPCRELLVRDTAPLVTWLPPSSTGPWLPMSVTGPWKVLAGQGGAWAGSVEASGPPPRSRVPVVFCAETGPDTVLPQTVRALAPLEVSGPLIVEFAT
jgi:hypothetical protein